MSLAIVSIARWEKTYEGWPHPSENGADLRMMTTGRTVVTFVTVGSLSHLSYTLSESRLVEDGAPADDYA